MSILEDASTPAVVEVTTNSSSPGGTSASFSPPAGSLVVVIVNILYNASQTTGVLTVKDSVPNTYTAGPTSGAFSTSNTLSAIFTQFYASAPGAITVNVTNSNLAAGSVHMAVRVLTGAAAVQTGAASQLFQGAASLNLEESLTPTVAGSYVYIGAGMVSRSVTETVIASTATVSDFADTTSGHQGLVGRQNSTGGTVSPGTPVTYGWTQSTSDGFTWAALEILPAAAVTTAASPLPARPGRTWLKHFHHPQGQPKYTLPVPQSFIPVQVAPTIVAAGTSGTVTLPGATTAGNTVVACITCDQSTTPPSVSGVTLGGSADNWVAAVTDAAGASVNHAVSIWYDPNCVGGQTSVVVSLAGGTGTGEEVYIAVYEIPAILTVDQTSTGDSASSATWSSGTTATTTNPNEILFGVCTGAAAIPVVTGVGTWTTQSNGSGSFDQICGYQIVSSLGTATFSGTVSTGKYAAAVATFFSGTLNAAVTPAAVGATSTFSGLTITATTTAVENQPAYNRNRLPIIGRVQGIQHAGFLAVALAQPSLATQAHFAPFTITATTLVENQPAYNRNRLPVIGRMLGIQHAGFLAVALAQPSLATQAHFASPTVTATTQVKNQPAYNRNRLPLIGRIIGLQHHGVITAQVTATALATQAHFAPFTITATTLVENAPAYNRNRQPPAGRTVGIKHAGTLSVTVTPTALAASTVLPAPGVQAVVLGINQPAYNRWRLAPVGRVIGLQHGGQITLLSPAPSAVPARAFFPGLTITASTAVENQPAYNRNRLPPAGRTIGVRHIGTISTTVPATALQTNAHFPATTITATTHGINQPAYNRWRLPPIGRTIGISHVGQKVASASALAARAFLPAPTIKATTRGINQPAYNRNRLPVIGRMLGISHVGTTGIAATPSAVSGQVTFPAATVAAGSVVPAAALGCSTTIPAVVPGFVPIAAVPVAGSTVFPALSFITNDILSPAALAASTTLPTPAINNNVVLGAPPVAAQVTFPAAVVNAGEVALDTALVLAAFFPVPLVLTSSQVTASALGARTTLPVPTVDTNLVLGPPAVAGSSGLPTPTVDVGVAPAALALAASAVFPVPAISTSWIATQASLATASHFPGPSIPVSAGTQGSAFLPAPTILANSQVTAVALGCSTHLAGLPSIPATSLGTAANFPVPVINEGNVPAAVALGATSYFPVPLVTVATVGTAALSAQAHFPAPVVAVTVSAVPVGAGAQFPALTVNISETPAPGALGASCGLPTPAINTNVPLSPPALAASTTLPVPLVRVNAVVAASALGASTVLPPPARNGVPAAALACSCVLPVPAITTAPTVLPSLAASSFLPAPVVLVTATEASLGATAHFPAPALNTGMKISPAALGATAYFPIAVFTANWTVAAAVAVGFNVGQSGPNSDRRPGEAPWISGIDVTSRMSETPWTSSQDGTIRMSEDPTIWTQGDGT